MQEEGELIKNFWQDWNVEKIQAVEPWSFQWNGMCWECKDVRMKETENCIRGNRERMRDQQSDRNSYLLSISTEPSTHARRWMYVYLCVHAHSFIVFSQQLWEVLLFPFCRRKNRIIAWPAKKTECWCGTGRTHTGLSRASTCPPAARETDFFLIMRGKWYIHGFIVNQKYKS